jgi:pentatricopeptide repeat protein
VLNTVAASPETSVLTLRWFLENVEIRKKSMDILHNIVLKLLCKKRRWGEIEALWVRCCRMGYMLTYSAMKVSMDVGSKPDIFILASLIRCYGKARRTDDVVRLFGMLEDLGISPDGINCYFAHGYGGLRHNVLLKEDFAVMHFNPLTHR